MIIATMMTKPIVQAFLNDNDVERVYDKQVMYHIREAIYKNHPTRQGLGCRDADGRQRLTWWRGPYTIRCYEVDDKHERILSEHRVWQILRNDLTISDDRSEADNDKTLAGLTWFVRDYVKAIGKIEKCREVGVQAMNDADARITSINRTRPRAEDKKVLKAADLQAAYIDYGATRRKNFAAVKKELFSNIKID